MSRYGLPDNPTTPTTITEWRQDTSTILLVMPDGSQKANPTHDDYIAAGWLEHIDDTPGADEKLDYTQYTFYPEVVSYKVISKTQDEIDWEIAETEEADSYETNVLDLLTSPLANITNDEAQEIVDELFDPTDVDAFTVDFLTAGATEQRTALNSMFAYLRVLVVNDNWINSKEAKNLVLTNDIMKTRHSIYLNNLEATVPPTVNDDITLGYQFRSLWRDNVGDKDYKCYSAVAGAADWREV